MSCRTIRTEDVRPNNEPSIAYLVLKVSSRRAHTHEDLVVDGPDALQDLPITRTGCHVECARQEVGANGWIGLDHCRDHVWEANIVADGESNGSKGCIR
jgi:hypothetical protein